MTAYGAVIFFTGLLLFVEEFIALLFGDDFLRRIFKGPRLGEDISLKFFSREFWKAVFRVPEIFFEIIYLIWTLCAFFTMGSRFAFFLVLLGTSWKKSLLKRFPKQQWWIKRVDSLLSMALIAGVLYCIWTNKRLI